MDEEVKLRTEPEEVETVETEAVEAPEYVEAPEEKADTEELTETETEESSEESQAVTDVNPLLDNPGHTEHTWLKGGKDNLEEICGDCSVKREVNPE